MNKTPISKIKKINSNDIYIKRDDLLEESFGGNKYRIAKEYFNDMKKQKKDVIIAYGNSRSNLCRVIAYLAFKNDIPCYIVSPNDDDGSRTNTFNSYLVNISNAKYVYCDKTNVSQTIEALLNQLLTKGFKPYYINGDKYGIGNEKTPVRAYEKTLNEILKQELDLGIKFDYIFFASGTGMTQSGLIAGKIINKSYHNIIGISVARKKEQQIEKINLYLNGYFDSNNVDYNEHINFVDDYICGGYGNYNSEISDSIIEIYKKSGIPLDPIYTGKAFLGMEKYLLNNNIKEKNILFIHTGGTPLFFDFINHQNKMK